MSRLATTVVTASPYTTIITETTSDEITVNRVQTDTADIAVEYFFSKFSATARVYSEWTGWAAVDKFSVSKSAVLQPVWKVWTY